MPGILKRFTKPDAEIYVLRPADELQVEVRPPRPPQPEARPAGDLPVFRDEDEEEPAAGPAGPEYEAPEEQPAAPPNPLDYAEVQAEAILEDARFEARKEREKAWAEFQEELEKARDLARLDGYNAGYADGLASGLRDGAAEMQEKARDQVRAVEAFLEGAAKVRDRVLDNAKEEIKEMALAIAEKVIRVSLKSSTDILRRMVEGATEKKKRCEWAHIYIADCDVRGAVNTIPELAAALRGISGRVRVIPMADDESGTCIIELPDEILDASVSTQLGNIRETLMNASLDEEPEPRPGPARDGG